MSSTSQLLLTGKPLDLIPNVFGFTDVTGVAVSTITTSDTITPIGYDSQTTWSINNGGTASVAGGAYTTSGNISPGQTLTLRATSSATSSTITTYTININGVTDVWSITTVAAPGQYLLESVVSSGTYNTATWTVPVGVTRISVCCIGGGGGGCSSDGTSFHGSGGGGALSYATFDVTPGETFTVKAGYGGWISTNYSVTAFAGYASSIVRVSNGTTMCLAAGGGGGQYSAGGVGGSEASGVGDIKRSGGSGGYITLSGTLNMIGPGGGGGAAGYGGNGTNGGALDGSSYNPYDPLSGTGGSATGGEAQRASDGGPGGGGGVGILGQGASGVVVNDGTRGDVGKGGSGGTNGTNGGGHYGGGGAAQEQNGSSGGYGGPGGKGAVRIIWPGNLRYFPSTRTANE